MTSSLLKACKPLVLTLLVATLAVSACGKKGDPIRPGQEKTEEKKSS